MVRIPGGPTTPRVTALFAVLVVVVGCATARQSFAGADSSAPGSGHPMPQAIAVGPSGTPVVVTPTPKPKPKPPPVSPIKPPHGPGPGGSLTHTGSKGVALTFDDGPDPKLTPRLLDLLKKNNVKATFCVLGYRAKAHPELIKRIVAEGHTLCNHTWDHSLNLAAKKAGGGYTHTDAQIRSDLKRTLDAIHAAVPTAKVPYFRAPGGNFTKRLVSIAASLGMKSIYWSVDPADWDNGRYGRGSAMTKHVISAVKHQVGAGGIVLSHDLSTPETIEAYKTLIPWLKARYKLIPLP